MDNFTITTAQIACMFDVTTKTVRVWALSWLQPAKITYGKFDAKKTLNLYIENQILAKYASTEGGESIEDARKRYEIARADRAELQAKEMTGELIQRDQAVKWVGALVTEAKMGFLAIPRRLSPVLYGKEIREIEGLLRSEIRAILEKMARGMKKRKKIA